METGHLPAGEQGDMVLGRSELTLKFELCLQERTIGRLLAALSALHSTERESFRKINCKSQHKAIDKHSDQVQEFMNGSLNGGHSEVDLRMCAYWLAGDNGTKLSMQNATTDLPADEPIEVVVRAGDSNGSS